MLDPVYVDALGHARRGRLQGIRRRVDVHLAVEHRGGEPFGVEPDFVGLAAVDLHAVHQEIVVIEESPVGERAGKTDVENVDEVGVEVDVAVHLSRELGDGEAVLHSRYAVGADDLARQRGVALAVVKVGRGFGDHGRQVSLPGEGRRVDVFEYEAEVALQPFVAEARLDVRQVELHLGVRGAVVAFVLVGVVLRLAAHDPFQDRVCGVLARGDDDAADAEFDRFQGEVYLVEAAPRERLGLCGVADHRGLYASHRIAGLERIDTLLIGRDAGRGAGEHDAHELHRGTAGGIRHTAADTGALCRQGRAHGQSCDQRGEQPVCNFATEHFAKIIKKNLFGQNKLLLHNLSRKIEHQKQKWHTEKSKRPMRPACSTALR